MRIEFLFRLYEASQNLKYHKATISPLLTFPRCACQQKEEGVDEVGAATIWESSSEKKEWSSGRRRIWRGE